MVVGDICAASRLVAVPLWHSPRRPEREPRDLRRDPQAPGEYEHAQPAIHVQEGGLSSLWRDAAVSSLKA
jgi:hypothetical protein